MKHLSRNLLWLYGVQCTWDIHVTHLFFILKELLENEQYRQQIKIKAQEANDKDMALQAKEYEEGLTAGSVQTQIKGHAAASHYGRSETSEDPVSTANTFQPGSWAPSKK